MALSAEAMPAVVEQPKPKTSLPIITTSEVKTFQRCRREHHYRYRLRVRPIQSSHALRFGTLMHRGLEAMWRAWMEGVTGDDVLSAALAAVLDEADEYDRIHAEELLRGYYLKWKDVDLEVLAVEAEFRTPILNPETGARSRCFELGGKMDAVVREIATGRVLLVEHKSTSEDVTAGSAYWRRLRLDPQVSNYLLGAASIGLDAAGCLYDVICKATLKPYKATPETDRRYVIDKHTKLRRLDARQHEQDETPEDYRVRVREAIAKDPEGFFVRGDVVRSADDEQDAAFDVWNIAREMREAERAERYPRNPHSCVSAWGSSCDYFDVCTHVASLDDPTRFRIAASAHEELAAAH